MSYALIARSTGALVRPDLLDGLDCITIDHRRQGRVWQSETIEGARFDQFLLALLQPSRGGSLAIECSCFAVDDCAPTFDQKLGQVGRYSVLRLRATMVPITSLRVIRFPVQQSTLRYNIIVLRSEK